LRQGPGAFQQTIRNRRFAVIDVGDDGKISDMTFVAQNG